MSNIIKKVVGKIVSPVLESPLRVHGSGSGSENGGGGDKRRAKGRSKILQSDLVSPSRSPQKQEQEERLSLPPNSGFLLRTVALELHNIPNRATYPTLLRKVIEGIGPEDEFEGWVRQGRFEADDWDSTNKKKKFVVQISPSLARRLREFNDQVKSKTLDPIVFNRSPIAIVCKPFFIVSPFVVVFLICVIFSFVLVFFCFWLLCFVLQYMENLHIAPSDDDAAGENTEWEGAASGWENTGFASGVGVETELDDNKDDSEYNEADDQHQLEVDIELDKEESNDIENQMVQTALIASVEMADDDDAKMGSLQTMPGVFVTKLLHLFHFSVFDWLLFVNCLCFINLRCWWSGNR